MNGMMFYGTAGKAGFCCFRFFFQLPPPILVRGGREGSCTGKYEKPCGTGIWPIKKLLITSGIFFMLLVDGPADEK
jgi:hypothetical protein